MRTSWDFFDIIYCISLAERSDRRQEARLQFRQVVHPVDLVRRFLVGVSIEQSSHNRKNHFVPEEHFNPQLLDEFHLPRLTYEGIALRQRTKLPCSLGLPGAEIVFLVATSSGVEDRQLHLFRVHAGDKKHEFEHVKTVMRLKELGKTAAAS